MNILNAAAVQYGLADIDSEEQFWTGITFKARQAVEQGVDLIVFPEYMTAHLLSLKPTMSHEDACIYLDHITGAYIDFFERFSRELNLMILAGTHICRENEGFVNKAFLFFPDGRMVTQNKLHLTPEERNRWSLIEGDRLDVFETDWGKMAILTCYDIEFPELARSAAVNGAELILCPSYTDTAYGYHRVRHCCQARAIENQLFVILSGIVGSLTERRPQIDHGYCQAGLFTPCDFPFNPEGFIQIGETNHDGVVIGSIEFAQLQQNRVAGVVAPFYDRRPGLYRL
ncbi:nitrilase-related carbon-nitrogen hydrolase [Paenibacillus solisilvae]|uniref:Nitrilase-related carbon-nitrogen hydrolase n=1 Tax=Paenibacillus solisilvae TaxID=2486751 RepID=A0ABW0VXP1_9BACL